jgi:hypothetical protein
LNPLIHTRCSQDKKCCAHGGIRGYTPIS